jgi:hypothetical protein
LLGKIRDPAAIPKLLDLLDDDVLEIRWRAAESLIMMGHDCVIPLLREVIKPERYRSTQFLDSARHVMRKLSEKGYIRPSIKVLEAFDSPNREAAVPWAAERLLEIMDPFYRS